MRCKYLKIKRFFDISLSLIGILCCAALLWWWIFVINIFSTKFHPIFLQTRLGKNQKKFNIIKFRSMKYGVNEYKPPMSMTGQEQFEMETKFGHFLRLSQLDETLQLLNILKGDMSFVGPRPGAALNEEELVAERLKYSPNAFDVRPGLTGLSQISLADRHNPAKKAKCDSEYVVCLSFKIDCIIFFKTIFKIFVK